MFRFFRRKKTPKSQPAAPATVPATAPEPAIAPTPAAAPTPAPASTPAPAAKELHNRAPAPVAPPIPTPPAAPAASPTPTASVTPTASPVPVAPATSQPPTPPAATPGPAAPSPATPAPSSPDPTPDPAALQAQVVEVPRTGWFSKLRNSLRKTGSAMDAAFTGGPIDETLYEELEMALLMADAGVAATEFLLDDLRRRVKKTKARHASAAKDLLREAITELLTPLEKTLDVGLYHPTVIIIAGVNGAGKTTSIGKLTRHLADAGARVLLAAADTFRAAAREQLQVWAGRNEVEIISQQGADPAAVSFDAVGAGRARDMDVVLIDTAGRLPTQKNLMQELAKIRRVVTKADFTAPHEVLLVIDGNTGQNALAQVKAFDEALGGLTGLIVTKLDGTAKGGVLCAIAREAPVPVYFIGVGEQLEDLQTFRASEFARALV